VIRARVVAVVLGSLVVVALVLLYSAGLLGNRAIA
jgi:hypothetical protein